MDSANPLTVHGNITHCRGVLFTRPGTYRVQVTCDGTIVAEHPLTVRFKEYMDLANAVL